MGLFNIIDKCPEEGYILKKWGQVGYRSTATAYMQRLMGKHIACTN